METITQEAKTGLIKVEEITGIMSGAGDILIKNQKLVAAAADKGKSYLDTIEGAEMSDEIDAALNEWQIKAKQALEIMNTRRSPITQMMTRMARAFTTLEAEIDPAKPESVYSRIQNIRNSFAKQKAEAARKKSEEILRNKNIADEKIRLTAEIEKQVRDAYQKKLYAFKKSANEKFNSMTLASVEETREYIKGLKLVYPRDKFTDLSVFILPVYMDSVEKDRMILVTKLGLYDELSANFRENMEDTQQSILGQFTSRVRELKDIANSNTETANRLEREAKERQEAEQARLITDQEKAKAIDAQNIEMNKQVATTGNLFDATEQLANINQNSGKTRLGYKITVKSMTGWGAIMAFWLTKEGITSDHNTIGKKTLEQMKAYCEKIAHKNNEKVIHADVVYEEDYKAIATKN
jgi:hypothetical protein